MDILAQLQPDPSLCPECKLFPPSFFRPPIHRVINCEQCGHVVRLTFRAFWRAWTTAFAIYGGVSVFFAYFWVPGFDGVFLIPAVFLLSIAGYVFGTLLWLTRRNTGTNHLRPAPVDHSERQKRHQAFVERFHATIAGAPAASEKPTLNTQPREAIHVPRSKVRRNDRRIYAPHFGKVLSKIAVGSMFIVLILAQVLDIIQTSYDVPWVVIVALFIFAIGSFLADRFAHRLTHKPGDNVLLEDTRAPVLYLREFDFDKEAGAIDDFIADLAREFGPPVCVGRPGERLPQATFHHLYRENDEWQATVDGLADQCRFLIVVVGATAGVLWELERVVSNSHFLKTVVLIRISHFRKIARAIESKLGFRCPEPIPGLHELSHLNTRGLAPYVFGDNGQLIPVPLIIVRTAAIKHSASLRLAFRKTDYVHQIDLAATLHPIFKVLATRSPMKPVV